MRKQERSKQEMTESIMKGIDQHGKLLRCPGMHWKSGYVKEVEGGEAAYRMLDGFDRPGREVDTIEWELDSYINYCLYPIHNCIEKMREKREEGDSVFEYADILDRLYDAACAQLGKMDDAICKDIGGVNIVTSNECCYGGFLRQDFLEVYVKHEGGQGHE